jgi:serine/threonine protein kinase
MIEEHVGPTHTYAILEYCAGGSLQRYLQKLTSKPRDRDGNIQAIPEGDCAVMAAQINAALAHLHRLDVAHRDLKPGNVLFAGDKWLKLCDFGFAKRCRGQRLHTMCGTPIYMAPELTQESKKGYEGHPVDMWAFGALLYEMLHNKVAFNGVSEQQLHQRIRGGTHAALRKDMSKGVVKLIKSLLTIDADKRLTSTAAESCKWFAPLVYTARTSRSNHSDDHDA